MSDEAKKKKRLTLGQVFRHTPDAALPDALLGESCWVKVGYYIEEGKVEKWPSRDGKQGLTWGDESEWGNYQPDRAGFVHSMNNDIMCADFDDALPQYRERQQKWRKRLAAATYGEKSMSGVLLSTDRVHFFGLARLAQSIVCQPLGIEIYVAKRVMVTTGQGTNNLPVTDIEHIIDELIAEMMDINISEGKIVPLEHGKKKKLPHGSGQQLQLREGERNNFIYRRCGELVHKDVRLDHIEQYLHKINADFCKNKPLPKDEIKTIISSSVNRDNKELKAAGLPPRRREVYLYAANHRSEQLDLEARLAAMGRKVKYNVIDKRPMVEQQDEEGNVIGHSSLADDWGEHCLWCDMNSNFLPYPTLIPKSGNFNFIKPAKYDYRALQNLVKAIAWKNRYDPALDWLNSLPTWDPKDEQLITPLSDFMGIAPEDVEMANAMYDVQFRLMVQMQLTPGIQQSIVWVNWGDPKTYKSTIGENFLPQEQDWFVGDLDLSKMREFRESKRVKLYIELQEGSGLTKETAKKLSNLITSSKDMQRLVFHTFSSTFHNRSMLYITTNDEQFIPTNCDGLLRRLVVTHVDRVHECWKQKGIVGMVEVGEAIKALINGERNLRFARAKWQLEQGMKAALPNHLMERVMDKASLSLETNTFWEERVRFYVEQLAPPLFLISDVISALQDSNGLSVSMPTSLDNLTKDALKRMLVQQTRRRRCGPKKIEKLRRYYVRPDWSSSDTPNKWVRDEEAGWVDTEEQPIVEPPKTIDDFTEEKKERVRKFAGKLPHDVIARGFKTTPSVIAQILGSW